jgi:saccharopine dehydrogenase (NAD+, L-lysine-forming)
VYPDIDTYVVLAAPWRWLMRAAGWAPLRRLLAGPRLQELLRRLPPGPEEEALARGFTRIWAQAEDPAGHQVTARLRGPEAHLFTARIALWIAQRALAGRVRVGFQTPVTAYGPDLIDRLAAAIEGVEVS